MKQDIRVKVRRILRQFKPYDRVYRHTEKEIANEKLRLARNPDDEPSIDFNDAAVVNEQVMLLKVLVAQGGVTDEAYVRIVSDEVDEDSAPVAVHALIE